MNNGKFNHEAFSSKTILTESTVACHYLTIWTARVLLVLVVAAEFVPAFPSVEFYVCVRLWVFKWESDQETTTKLSLLMNHNKQTKKKSKTDLLLKTSCHFIISSKLSVLKRDCLSLRIEWHINGICCETLKHMQLRASVFWVRLGFEMNCEI